LLATKAGSNEDGFMLTPEKSAERALSKVWSTLEDMVVARPYNVPIIALERPNSSDTPDESGAWQRVDATFLRDTNEITGRASGHPVMPLVVRSLCSCQAQQTCTSRLMR